MEIHFEIENQCLLRCIHCSSNASAEGEAFCYSSEDLINFLAAIPEDKMIFFTGGEPLLSRDFEDLLVLLKEKFANITVGIFSSGILKAEGKHGAVSAEYAVRLHGLGLKICYFSIYSHEAIEHDRMTMAQGSFELVLKSIENMRRAGIEIRFNTVVTKRNQGQLASIIEMAARLGATEVRLLKLIKHGRACSSWDKIGITEGEYRSIVKEILGRKNPVKITASGVIDLTACRSFEKTAGCPAGVGLLYVTFKGDIYPCASAKKKSALRIGNIKEKNTWESYMMDRKRFDGHPLCVSER